MQCYAVLYCATDLLYNSFGDIKVKLRSHITKYQVSQRLTLHPQQTGAYTTVCGMHSDIFVHTVPLPSLARYSFTQVSKHRPLNTTYRVMINGIVLIILDLLSKQQGIIRHWHTYHTAGDRKTLVHISHGWGS